MLVLLAVVSSAGAVAEAGLLTCVVLIATQMSAGERGGSLTIGPFDATGLSVSGLLVLSMVLALARTALLLTSVWLPARISADAQARIRRRLLEGFTRAQWSLQAEEREGRLQELVSSQAANAGNAVLNLATVVVAVWSFVVLILSAVVVNPAVAAGALATAVALIAGLRPLTSLTRAAGKQLRTANLDLAGGVSEAVRMAEELHVFGAEEAQSERLVGMVERVRESFLRTQLLSRGVGAVFQGLVMMLLVAGLAVLHVTGASNISSLGAIVLILVRSLSYGQTAQSVYQSFVSQLPSVQVIDEAVRQYEGAVPPSGSLRLERVDLVKLRTVEFWYQPLAPVLRRVDLEVHRGEVLGVVGPSGAGKSTLIQVMLGLRSPCVGEFLVNGEPLVAYCRSDWLKRIAYVPQESRLVAASVAENVRFFRRHISDEAVVSAVDRVGLMGELGMGTGSLNRVVGQRADAVSGGQRQRLAIARALAADPDFVVLDEPTSSLDARSEALVLEAINGMRRDAAVVVVTHRLSMLDRCDRVIVMVGGQIVLEGSPDAVRASVIFKDALSAPVEAG